jgi:hypothetical protein
VRSRNEEIVVTDHPPDAPEALPASAPASVPATAAGARPAGTATPGVDHPHAIRDLPADCIVTREGVKALLPGRAAKWRTVGAVLAVYISTATVAAFAAWGAAGWVMVGYAVSLPLLGEVVRWLRSLIRPLRRWRLRSGVEASLVVLGDRHGNARPYLRDGKPLRQKITFPGIEALPAVITALQRRGVTDLTILLAAPTMRGMTGGMGVSIRTGSKGLLALSTDLRRAPVTLARHTLAHEAAHLARYDSLSGHLAYTCCCATVLLTWLDTAIWWTVPIGLALLLATIWGYEIACDRVANRIAGYESALYFEAAIAAFQAHLRRQPLPMRVAHSARTLFKGPPLALRRAAQRRAIAELTPPAVPPSASA